MGVNNDFVCCQKRFQRVIGVDISSENLCDITLPPTEPDLKYQKN